MQVALLAEGVDRNIQGLIDAVGFGKSPSSRRAWIEIGKVQSAGRAQAVALLAEGVDRNLRKWRKAAWSTRRPPRGGRG